MKQRRRGYHVLRFIRGDTDPYTAQVIPRPVNGDPTFRYAAERDRFIRARNVDGPPTGDYIRPRRNVT